MVTNMVTSQVYTICLSRLRVEMAAPCPGYNRSNKALME